MLPLRARATALRALSLASVVVAGVVALTPSRARADEPPSSSWHVTPGVGAGFEIFDYREDVQPPFKSTQHGVLPTAALDLVVASPGRMFFARLAGAASLGAMTYDGSTQAGAPLSAGTSGFLAGGELDVGLRFQPGSAPLSLGGYVGGGVRYWDRDLSGTSGGYDEGYVWAETPIGALAAWDDERFAIGLDVAAVPTFGGSVHVGLSVLEPALADPTLGLGPSVGFRARLPARVRLGGNVWLTLTPTFSFASFGRSELQALKTKSGQVITTAAGTIVIAEPASRTLRGGATLGLAYEL